MLSPIRFKFDFMSRWVVVLLLLMCCMKECRSSRFNEYSCYTLRPAGATMPENINNLPFIAVAQPASFIPGVPVTITISSPILDSQTFSGLLLQARFEGSTTPVGSFTIRNGYTSLDCGGDSGATLIDDGTDEARSLPQTFEWNSPDVRRTIIIYIDIEIRKGEFWWFRLIIPPVDLTLGCPLDNPCQNGGLCSTDEDGEVYCVCEPPFTGPLCTDCITTPCDDAPDCIGDASFCVPESCTTYTCCVSIKTECAACGHNPCLNGGTCMHDLNLPWSFSCICPLGYSGRFCDALEIDTLLQPPMTYQLPSFEQDLLDSGLVIYLLFIPGDLSEIQPDIQGYDYSYGLGMPNQNPQRAPLPLIVDVNDNIWFCLRRTDSSPSFRLDIQSPFVFSLPIQDDNRPFEFQLQQGILGAFSSGTIDCFTSTVNVNTVVQINNIQGFAYSYGTGMPVQNRQTPDMGLNVMAGGSFWFCLDPIPQPFPPTFIFSLNLT